jgi:predicted MPP superfamily phosphohydrolase
MRLAWLTDIHLNFLNATKRRRFLESIKERANAFTISGDIGESHDLAQYLLEMDQVIQKPIYFVLGNHDFYRDSITKIRQRVVQLVGEKRQLNYLTTMGVTELSPHTAIIGHDGWPDGRLGDFRGTDVILNDHILIEEIAQWYKNGFLNKVGLSNTMIALANEAAQHLEQALAETVAKYTNIIAVTHVPPFRESAWYQGKISGDDFLPYIACKIVGDVLKKVMGSNPQSNLLVLCGHTHGGGEVQVLPNLQVLTGEAEYGDPVVQTVLEIG